MNRSTSRDRGRRFRLLTATGAGLLLVPLAAACGSGDSGGSGPIKIGVPAPLSGDSASAGQDILAAARVAAAEINKAGGVDGRDIEIVEADDQCSAQQGAQAAQKLLNSGVVAVAGGYCSGAAVPAIPIYGRRNVPFVLDASTNPSLTDTGKGKVFRTCGRDDNQGLVAAKFMTGQLRARRIALLHDNTTYAKGLADAAANSVKRLGGQVVYQDALQPGQSDYSPVLTKVASTKPDVLYFTGYFAEAGLLMKQRRQLGLTFTLMGGDATTDSTVLKTAGSAADGYIATTAPLAKDLPAAATTMIEAARADAADAPPWWVAEITGHDRRAADLAVLTLTPERPLPFRPGQHVTVQTPRWPRVWRSYWIANAPRPDGTLCLHVRARPAGWVSGALVRHTAPGDSVLVGPAAGAMPLDPDPDRGLLLIGGGTGLAPMKALAEQAVATDPDRDVHLIVGARTEADLYDLADLRLLESSGARLRVVPVPSRSSGASAGESQGGAPGEPPGESRGESVGDARGDARGEWRGRLPDVLPGFLDGVDRWRDRAAYVAGPPPFVRDTVDALHRHGMPLTQVHHDPLTTEESDARAVTSPRALVESPSSARRPDRTTRSPVPPR
ncbi:ABC-type branched-subunit amino acid transport system substrate-binding protein [Actinomadura pelletieri DSM 43383]|uniref:ABC-type branched-subunit amino acid transport system substrate-binding protein n=1 Tax=Actinomadura pelletieri DSM 43383 TaxID=1120940 RepID=A0A495QM69_9ACTN|nr:ABC transporter substrate-binding protein [Actinomadura pelletieri]RKS73660.1 ABC-type branched-subunit amino acid transport system substrate-binding protein [Actinomadura pelletieri DSM 43383]